MIKLDPTYYKHINKSFPQVSCQTNFEETVEYC